MLKTREPGETFVLASFYPAAQPMPNNGDGDDNGDDIQEFE